VSPVPNLNTEQVEEACGCFYPKIKSKTTQKTSSKPLRLVSTRSTKAQTATTATHKSDKQSSKVPSSSRKKSQATQATQPTASASAIQTTSDDVPSISLSVQGPESTATIQITSAILLSTSLSVQGPESTAAVVESIHTTASTSAMKITSAILPSISLSAQGPESTVAVVKSIQTTASPPAIQTTSAILPSISLSVQGPQSTTSAVESPTTITSTSAIRTTSIDPSFVSLSVPSLTLVTSSGISTIGLAFASASKQDQTAPSASASRTTSADLSSISLSVPRLTFMASSSIVQTSNIGLPSGSVSIQDQTTTSNIGLPLISASIQDQTTTSNIGFPSLSALVQDQATASNIGFPHISALVQDQPTASSLILPSTVDSTQDQLAASIIGLTSASAPSQVQMTASAPTILTNANGTESTATPVTLAAQPTATLARYVPVGLDTNNLNNLVPANTSDMYYAGVAPGANASTATVAKLSVALAYVSVVLDHSASIDSAICENDNTTMVIDFNNAAGFGLSESEWIADGKVILISSDPTCDPIGSSSSMFLAENIVFDTHNLIATATGEMVSLSDVLNTLDLGFGTIDVPGNTTNTTSTSVAIDCGTPTNQTTLPTAACGANFDASLDAAIGFYSGNESDSDVSLSDIYIITTPDRLSVCLQPNCTWSIAFDSYQEMEPFQKTCTSVCKSCCIRRESLTGDCQSRGPISAGMCRPRLYSCCQHC